VKLRNIIMPAASSEDELRARHYEQVGKLARSFVADGVSGPTVATRFMCSTLTMYQECGFTEQQVHEVISHFYARRSQLDAKPWAQA